MGGPGAAPVGPRDAPMALARPADAFVVRYVDPYHPDLVALEDPEKVHKPVTLPDQIVGNDVHAFLQVDPDGSVAGIHRLVQEGTGGQAEPLKTVGLDDDVPRVVLGTHAL